MSSEVRSFSSRPRSCSAFGLQVLELLLAMCGVGGLRPLLCEVVFRPAAAPKLGAPGPSPGLALLLWLSSPVEGAEGCSLQALQLLNQLLEVRGGGAQRNNFLQSIISLIIRL